MFTLEARSPRARWYYVTALPHLQSPHPADCAPWRPPLRLQENTSDTGNVVRMDSRLDQEGCEEPCGPVCVLVAVRPDDWPFRSLPAGVGGGGCGSCGVTDWLSAAGCSGCWSQAEATQQPRLPHVDSRGYNSVVKIHYKQQAGGIEPFEHAADMFWPGNWRLSARWGHRGDRGRRASSRGSACVESVCWQPGGSSISLMLQVPQRKKGDHTRGPELVDWLAIIYVLSMIIKTNLRFELISYVFCKHAHCERQSFRFNILI